MGLTHSRWTSFCDVSKRSGSRPMTLSSYTIARGQYPVSSEGWPCRHIEADWRAISPAMRAVVNAQPRICQCLYDGELAEAEAQRQRLLGEGWASVENG